MKVIFRLVIILIVILAILVGAVGGLALSLVRKPLPQTEGTIALAGLNGEVTIRRDSYGVAHIYAASLADLIFAQGFVHAQERWWQMEFQRHIGMGRIGELVGDVPRVRANDIFIRTVGWNRAAQADADAASPETRAFLESYSAGVNAYIAGKTGGELGVEYSLLGVTGVTIPIEPWQPVHTFAWAKVLAWQLSNGYDLERDMITLRKTFGADTDTYLNDLMPPYPGEVFPYTVEPSDFSGGILSAASLRPPTGIDYSHVATTMIGDMDALNTLLPHGASNSWVVAGSRTTTGKPLLANDPHLGQQSPALFYQIGLHCTPVTAACPLDVTGFSLPGAPFILIGRNARIAWGLTTPPVDNEDLYIITPDPADPTKYILDGESIPFTMITETIRFGDGTAPLDVPVKITRWGPLVTSDKDSEGNPQQPMALRWTGIEGTTDLIGSSYKLNIAANFDEFREALKTWNTPSQNFVYADVDGNIGYQLPGKVPIRGAGHSGLFPVDGSVTTYDWKGFLPYDLMPRLYNPERGYILTANQAITPPEYAAMLAGRLDGEYGEGATYLSNQDPAYGFRAGRIRDLILATEQHSVDTFKAMQADTFSYPASKLLLMGLGYDYGDTIPAAFLAWLRGWNYTLTAESGQAVFSETFWNLTVQKLWRDELGQGYGLGSRGVWATILQLGQPDSRWWDDVTTPAIKETRDDILKAAFLEAYQTVTKHKGVNYETWRWGDVHRVTFLANPLGVSGIAPIESLVNSGPIGVGGGSATINRQDYLYDAAIFTFEVDHVSVLRLIVDFNDLEASWWSHAPGQSGHPASGNYRDQLEMWARVGYLPMVTIPEKMGEVKVLNLRPTVLSR